MSACPPGRAQAVKWEGLMLPAESPRGRKEFQRLGWGLSPPPGFRGAAQSASQGRQEGK